jgi:hypothetical protein
MQNAVKRNFKSYFFSKLHSIPLLPEAKKIIFGFRSNIMGRMRKAALWFICNFCLLLLLQAQNLTATVKGRVTDQDNGQPLVGVNIIVLNTNPMQGAVTDEKGNFRISNVKVGRCSIKFSYTGYESAYVSELEIASGKETTIAIAMQEKVGQISQAVITANKDKSAANNEFATVSAYSFQADEMSRYSATEDDPARMVQSFAGVMTASDDNNEIVVRGNSPRGLLWRMEGIEIPDPNHFAGSEGSTGGGVSILSSTVLTNTDFYTSAFPAEFGDALSGVMDLNLRKGNTDQHEFTFQAGVLGLEAALEGPWSKNYDGSYLINYRYSTLQLLGYAGFKIGGDVLPKYQDLTFNFYFPTKHIGSFTLWGIGGLSSLGQQAPHDSAEWTSLADQTEYTQNQMIGIIGATHLYLFKNNKTYIKTVASYSYTNNQDTNDTIGDNYQTFNWGGDKFIYKTIRASVVVNHKINAKDLIRTGLVYSNIGFNLFSNAYNFTVNQMQTQVNNAGATSTAEAFVQWKHRFNERLFITSGVHLTYCFLNNHYYIEPRVGGEWKITETQTLSFGAGLHSRIDDMSTYFSYVDTTPGHAKYPNKDLSFSRAVHAVLGYNFNFKRDFHLKTEIYGQYLFDVPIGADSADATYSILNYDDGFVNIPLKSTGTGYNYGVEITLEKFFTKNYYFMYTASLYESKYKAADDIWRSTAYDVHYVMNLLGGKEFIVGKKKNNVIGVDAKIIWRGGQRYTPVNLPASIAAEQTIYDNSVAFSDKLPDYFRIDFGTYFRRNRKKYSWTVSFDAQNIINRQNVEDIIYNEISRNIQVEDNLGIIPVLSWKIQFGI